MDPIQLKISFDDMPVIVYIILVNFTIMLVIQSIIPLVKIIKSCRYNNYNYLIDNDLD